MDKEDVLRERINSLIDNELLSVEMLQEATGIEKDSLEKFLFENGVKLSSDDMKDSQRRLRLFGISDCLIEGMKVPEDFDNFSFFKRNSFITYCDFVLLFSVCFW